MRQKLVVSTDAGVSAESGIPTFRDYNGMWEKYDAMKLASVEGFEEDPQVVHPKVTDFRDCLAMAIPVSESTLRHTFGDSIDL